MKVVLLREHSHFALLPRPLLHTHKPEIVELGQSGKGRLLVRACSDPGIDSGWFARAAPEASSRGGAKILRGGVKVISR